MPEETCKARGQAQELGVFSLKEKRHYPDHEERQARWKKELLCPNFSTLSKILQSDIVDQFYPDFNQGSIIRPSHDVWSFRIFIVQGANEGWKLDVRSADF